MAYTIPPIKKTLPTSPDQIQRFSSESEAAVARMAHLNRLSLYVGNEMEINDPVDYTVSNVLSITKPAGYVRFVNLNTPAGSSDTVILEFDPILANEAVGVSTPTFVQLTMGSADAVVVISVATTPVVDGTVEIKLSNVDATDPLTEAAFFYTIIPQLL